VDLDLRYTDASSSGEEQVVDEGETDEDNIAESGMPQDTRRNMAGEIEAIKRERDALTLEVEELRDHIRSVWVLKEHVDKVTKERDVLISEAEHEAAIIENLKKERDALRHETEKLRAQCEESGKLEDRLNSLIQTCKDIAEERDALLLKAQIKPADKDTLNKVRDALKLETQNLLDQREANALLEDQLNVARMQCDEIAKERDSLKLRYRRSEEDFNAARKFTECLKVETEKLRAQLNGYALLKEEIDAEILQRDVIAKERDSSKIKYLRSESNSKAVREVMEALKIETEEIRAKLKNSSVLQKQLNSARQQYGKLKKERNVYELRAQQIVENREDVKIERDALKLEAENFRARVKHANLLEKQIKAVRLQCDNIKTEIDLYKLKSDRQQRIETLREKI
jgi:hypothetical protein